MPPAITGAASRGIRPDATPRSRRIRSARRYQAIHAQVATAALTSITIVSSGDIGKGAEPFMRAALYDGRARRRILRSMRTPRLARSIAMMLIVAISPACRDQIGRAHV